MTYLWAPDHMGEGRSRSGASGVSVKSGRRQGETGCLKQVRGKKLKKEKKSGQNSGEEMRWEVTRSAGCIVSPLAPHDDVRDT